MSAKLRLIRGWKQFVDIQLRLRSILAMPTYVTRPFLPPLEEFLPYLEAIWDRRVLSNAGPYHTQFEAELCSFLKIDHISLFGNGTLALMVALKALEIENAEIITTPYSFVATTSSMVWQGNTPVFVDIEHDSTNIDPAKIEKAITKNTKAILAVHCYGHPCDTKAIDAIAKKHGLKVIYDAAHAFAIETESGSILKHGDLSILSFHATKAFNTFEGGAIVCHSAEMKERIDRLKNFGFNGETRIEEIGINAKMNEFGSALGLVQMKYFAKTTELRGRIDQRYRQSLQGVKGVKCLENTKATFKNYSYFPILVQNDFPISRDGLYDFLKENDIYSRRYFYPLISNFPLYAGYPTSSREHLPIANQVADQVLCLPIFPELPLEKVDEICDLIKKAGR